MHVPPELRGVLSIDPEVMGGDVCFIGTRIPVVMLLDNVATGVSMEEFYESYPSLTPCMVSSVLGWDREAGADSR